MRVGKNAEKNGTSVHSQQECKMILRRQYKGSSKNQTYLIHNPISRCLSKRIPPRSWKEMCISCSSQHHSQQARAGSNPHVYESTNKKIWYKNTVEYYAAFKKRKPVTYYYIDEPRGYYGKQNKTVTNGQIMYVSIYTYYLKQSQSQNHKVEGGN